MPWRSTMGPRLPKSRRNFPSGENFTSVSPGAAPAIQTFFSRSVKIVCTALGHTPSGAEADVPQDLQQIALDVEFQHGRRRGLGVLLRTAQHPDMILRVDIHAGDRPHGPAVRQRLRPAGNEFVDFGRGRKVRRRCRRLRGVQRSAKCQHRDRCDGPPISAHDPYLPQSRLSVRRTAVRCSFYAMPPVV